MSTFELVRSPRRIRRCGQDTVQTLTDRSALQSSPRTARPARASPPAPAALPHTSENRKQNLELLVLITIAELKL